MNFKDWKLSKHQNEVLGWVLDGADIQVTSQSTHDGNYVTTYDVVFDNGDSIGIRKKTFERLREMGLIKLKYSPSLDAERWG